jgi:glycosyltransferase involved in cell wall biosynthesis
MDVSSTDDIPTSSAASSGGLRVAFVTELYPPSVGGQQNRFYSLANGLAALGAEVTVLCVRHAPGLPADESMNGVRVIRGPLLPRYEAPILKPLQRSLMGTLRYALRTRTLLARGNYDAVYFNQWPYLHVVVAPSRVRRISLIDWCELRTGLVHRTMIRSLPRIVGANCSVNEWVATGIASASGAEICYLPTGVSVKEYAPVGVQSRGGILFLGRLVANKNLALLIEAYEELYRRGSREPLIIAGDGPDRALIGEQIARLPADVRASISMLGEVDEPTKRSLLATSRVLAISSTREGFPNVVAEAIAAELPVGTVDFPLNGTARIVHRYGIGVVGEGTAIGLADALSKVIANRQHYAKRCADVADELDWTRLSIRLHSILSGLSRRWGDGNARGARDAVGR